VQAHSFIEAAQEQFTAIQQRGFCTKAVENRGEFHGDIAAAYHQHALGQLFKEEGFVRTNGMLMPRHIRDLRPAASGNQDVLGAVAFTAQLDAVLVDNSCMPLKQSHATVDQQVPVDAIKPFDFTVFIGDQRRPIEIGLAE
jgi:hypothetical protein